MRQNPTCLRPAILGRKLPASRFLEKKVESLQLRIHFKIMKESKLAPHGEFIMARAIANISFSQIRRDLAAKDCKTSLSRLTEWIETKAAAQGIELPPRKRGRPVETKPTLFSFLPQFGEPAPGSIPPILYALQEMPPQNARSLRDHALEELGLPTSKNPTATEVDDVQRLKNLSDTDLCLLALLRSDLPAPPLTKGHEELTRWFSKLIKYACDLRAEIRATEKG